MGLMGLGFVLLLTLLDTQIEEPSLAAPQLVGRVVQTQAPTGTGTAAYDHLNRPRRSPPPAGQGATFQYLKDPALKRLVSRMTVTGTGTWEWRGDGKGPHRVGAEPLPP